MILRILKANHVYNFVLVPIIGILLLLKTIITGGVFPTNECLYTSPLCTPILDSGISFTGAVLINFLLIIATCFLIFHINARFAFVREQTFLPSYLFLLIVLAFPHLHLINPIFISIIFLLFGVRSIFNSFEKRIAIRNSFNAGFFIGLAGIFFLEVSLLILIIPTSIFIIRNKITWREIVVPFIGFLLPWLLLFSGYFIFGEVDTLISLLENSLLEKDKLIFLKLPVQLFLSYLILLIGISSMFIIRQYGIKNISVRRYFKVLFIVFASSILLLLLPSVGIEGLVLLTIPVTFLLTNFLIHTKRKTWAEILLDLLIVVVVTIQFFI